MVNVDELGQKAVELNKNFNESFIELGRTLRVIQQIGGVEDFRRICDAAGIGTRKAYYLASISEKIEGLHIPTKRLKAVGWTKLMTISPFLTKETWKEMLERRGEQYQPRPAGDRQGRDAGEQPALRPALFQRGGLQGLRQVGDQLTAPPVRGVGLLHKEKAVMALVKKDLDEPHEAAPKKPSAAKKKLLA